MPLLGRVLWWDARDSEGVILDSEGREFYFNCSVIAKVPKNPIKEKSFVHFEINKQVTHLLCAANVLFLNARETAKVHREQNRSRQPELGL